MVPAMAERSEDPGPTMETNFLPARLPNKPFSRKPSSGSAGMIQRWLSMRSSPMRGAPASALIDSYLFLLREFDPGSRPMMPDRAPNAFCRDSVLFLRASAVHCLDT